MADFWMDWLVVKSRTSFEKNSFFSFWNLELSHFQKGKERTNPTKKIVSLSNKTKIVGFMNSVWINSSVFSPKNVRKGALRFENLSIFSFDQWINYLVIWFWKQVVGFVIVLIVEVKSTIKSKLHLFLRGSTMVYFPTMIG